MDEALLLKLLGSAPGGVALAAVLVFVLYRVLSSMAARYIEAMREAAKQHVEALDRSSERQSAALERVVTSVTEHTRVDLEHHAIVKETIVRLEAKVDTALGITPTGGYPRQDPDPDFGVDRPPSRPRRKART